MASLSLVPGPLAAQAFAAWRGDQPSCGTCGCFLPGSGAGVAVGPGAGGIALVNQNGAVLTLSGRQLGVIVAADLNGLVITVR